MKLPVSFDRISEIAESDSISGQLLFEDAIAILVLAGAQSKSWSLTILSQLPRVFDQLKAELKDSANDAIAQAEALVKAQSLEALLHNARVHGVAFDPQANLSAPVLAEKHIPGFDLQWRMTDEHERSLRIIAAEQDESFAIEGFSGTGKTTFTSMLSTILEPRTTLLAAQSPFQLTALESRVPGFQGITFSALVRLLYASIHNLSPGQLGQRYRATYALSHERVAEVMQFPVIGTYAPARIAQMAAAVVRNFCSRTLPHISEDLLPKALRLSLSTMHKQLILQCAGQLWEATMTAPSKHNPLPVRGYHLMKWLALEGHSIPLSLATHILIDESHDVPPSMLALFDASEVAIISLGDRFQHFGDNFSPNRSQRVRSRQFQQSVRSDANLGDVLNGILQYHPKAPQVEFIGNPERNIKEHKYSRLDDATLAKFSQYRGQKTILCGYIWTVATTIQRLAAGGHAFSFMGINKDLVLLIYDAERLFSGNSRFITHPMLINYTSWAALKAQAGSAILSLENLFSRGYTGKHFEESMDKSTTPTKDQLHAVIQVGLVEHAKNREYEHVLLASDIRYGQYSQINERAGMVSSVYTGLTRGTRSLTIHEDMIEKLLHGLAAQAPKQA
jgi:hypothetical protein